MINPPHRFTEPPRMSFMEGLQSLYSTTIATVRAGTRGIASRELYESRLKVCESCSKRELVGGVVWRCGVCNCLLHLKAGASASVCPWFKWPGDQRFGSQNRL